MKLAICFSVFHSNHPLSCCSPHFILFHQARLEEDKFKQNQKKGSHMGTPRDSYNSTPASRPPGRKLVSSHMLGSGK